jgi:hypothetical protein
MGAVLLCFVAVLGFSGCDLLRALGFGEDDPAPEEPGNTPYVWKGAPVNPNSQSIKAKFGVTLTGTAGVNAAFKELSAFIKNEGLTNQSGVIKLGDYIDLEGGLVIAAGYTFSSNNVPAWNNELTGSHGKLSRLIVVGINSFQSVPSGYQYPEPTPPQHVVFQFQNITHDHRMNAYDGNAGGYAVTEMREYVRGYFLAGLIDAGVPDEVLWPPARMVSARPDIGTSVDPAEIQDKLWLPTAWEMGSATNYILDETAANQARLEYYKDDSSRVKYGTSGAKPYWLASMTSQNYTAFVSIKTDGTVRDKSGMPSPMNDLGVAPAFCVQ